MRYIVGGDYEVIDNYTSYNKKAQICAFLRYLGGDRVGVFASD